jgi:hypothetical protein
VSALTGDCCPQPEYYDVGRAAGWLQCKGCGRFFDHDEAELDFSNALLSLLRESWWMRQPGGGVTRKQWIVATQDGRIVCYNEVQALGQARQSAQRFLELEPEATVYLFEVQASGLVGLHETASQPAYARPLAVGVRSRLSPLATRTPAYA